MSRFIFILVLIFLGFGCTQSVNSLIKNWEQSNHQIYIDRIIENGQPQAFKGNDSLLILREIYNIEKGSIEMNLRQQWDSLTSQIEKAKDDIQLTTNPIMKKALANGMKSLEFKRHKIQLIDSVYKIHPESTRLLSVMIKMKEYAQYPDQLLGYTVEMEFSGNQGLLPSEVFHKKYLLDINQHKIIGELIIAEK
jgi:hypothetical protein